MNVNRLVKWDGQIIMEFELLVVTCFVRTFRFLLGPVFTCAHTHQENPYSRYSTGVLVFACPGMAAEATISSWVFPTTIHCPYCHFCTPSHLTWRILLILFGPMDSWIHAGNAGSDKCFVSWLCSTCNRYELSYAAMTLLSGVVENHEHGQALGQVVGDFMAGIKQKLRSDTS